MQWFFSKSLRKLWHTDAHEPSAPWRCDASNDVVQGCTGCPLGTFTLGAAEYNEPDEADDLRSMGPYFIPVYGTPGHSGIGIHGGGSASPHPLAAQQGLFPTENCIRVNNDDLYHIALNVTAGDTLTVMA